MRLKGDETPCKLMDSFEMWAVRHERRYGGTIILLSNPREIPG
jgi:hypothetical protein